MQIFTKLYKATVKTVDHDGIEHAGYMSFMLLLSFFPFLIFFLVTTSIVGASNTGQQLVKWLLLNLPNETTASIKIHIAYLTQVPPKSLMTLALFGSVWTVSSFVEGIRTILNRIYEVQSPPRYWIRRLLSIIQFLFISLCIFCAVGGLIIVPTIAEYFEEIGIALKALNPMWKVIRYTALYSILFLSALMLYYLIPNVKLNPLKLLPGALLSTLLWVVSGRLLSNYITRYKQLDVVYGSLGSIIATLLFFYIANIIFIYGAEFNRLLWSQDTKMK
jgi:membrane protein